MEATETTTENAPAETPPETPAGAEAAADAFDDPKVESFDRAYVEKLRKEAASHRTEAQRYKEAFKGWDPEADVPVWLETIQLAQQPGMQQAAADRLRQIADLIHKGDTPEEAVAKVDGEPPKEPEYLTPEQLEQKLQEREQEKAVADQVQAIKSKAAELGYAENTREYHSLLWTAQNETGFDLEKAHEKLQADRQAVIDSFLEEKRLAAEGNPAVAAGGAHVDGSVQHDGSFATARARTEARLKAWAKSAE